MADRVVTKTGMVAVATGVFLLGLIGQTAGVVTYFHHHEAAAASERAENSEAIAVVEANDASASKSTSESLRRIETKVDEVLKRVGAVEREVSALKAGQ